MRQLAKTCSCGRRVEPGQTCPCGRSKPTATEPRTEASRTHKPRRERREAEPWRQRYDATEYQKQRQIAVARTKGLCGRCKTPVADFRSGRWKMRPGCGTHHINPLYKGGSDDAGNLVALCRPCHAKADAGSRRFNH